MKGLLIVGVITFVLLLIGGALLLWGLKQIEPFTTDEFKRMAVIDATEEEILPIVEKVEAFEKSLLNGERALLNLTTRELNILISNDTGYKPEESYDGLITGFLQSRDAMRADGYDPLKARMNMVVKEKFFAMVYCFPVWPFKDAEKHYQDTGEEPSDKLRCLRGDLIFVLYEDSPDPIKLKLRKANFKGEGYTEVLTDQIVEGFNEALRDAGEELATQYGDQFRIDFAKGALRFYSPGLQESGPGGEGGNATTAQNQP